MSNKGKGICLVLGPVVAFIGWILYQATFIGSTENDDIAGLLSNAEGGTVMATVVIILIIIGLPMFVAGLRGTKGQAGGTFETLGIGFVTLAVIVFVATIGLLGTHVEMGDKFAEYMAGTQSTDAAVAAKSMDAAYAAQISTGAVQAFNVAANNIGSLLWGAGFFLIGVAYTLNSSFKSIIPAIPLGPLAAIIGILIIVSVLIIDPTAGSNTAGIVGGISFAISVLWSVLVGAKLATSSD
ncbi:MAG: hypothetical protein CL904_02450 [Dehalococcoidia bacterium]|nr:hypothetical protein [Dehalococcoidia bacterium]MQG15591.1 hypothetical protein [SAR202 cluster bacterium]|tara:strand:+ start:67006 stop:67725 length:720 start_codon:yes stop_codon:yes gene_type:complete